MFDKIFFIVGRHVVCVVGPACGVEFDVAVELVRFGEFGFGVS